LNTTATILTRTLSGVYAGDGLTMIGGTANFDTPAVGLGKKVTGTGFSLTGTDVNNYVLGSTTLYTTANITYTTVAGHKFLQPVNLYPDPRSSFKITSTIPVKFQIFLADGVTPYGGAVASIQMKQTSPSVTDPVNEDILTTPADAGTYFRYDGNQYIYNMGTKTLASGTYLLTAILDDKSTVSQYIELRSK
jgi:hypothetical protein